MYKDISQTFYAVTKMYRQIGEIILVKHRLLKLMQCQSQQNLLFITHYGGSSVD